ncbi:hypothetical protein Syun_020829 [Stephania yunnanensis]|uniref:Uncharacterized protein n=1 Tax=Stephania yunnanensis TaxID=152371 RepID=A0AAP0IGG9_9MAGN
MSNPQVPQHEGNQQFHRSSSLEDMMKQLIDSHQQFRQLFEEIRQIDFKIPNLKDLETQLIQYNVRLQNMTDEEELCSTKPIFNPDEDVSVYTLRNFEIFYTADTFVLDDLDATDSFMLEVLNELLNLKEDVHASLPKYVDASFVVDISKGESNS